MIGPDLLARVTAEAVVPEQLLPYVRTVSGTEPSWWETVWVLPRRRSWCW